MAQYSITIRLKDIEEKVDGTSPERALLNALLKLSEETLALAQSATVEWGWSSGNRVMSRTVDLGSAVELKPTVETRRS